MGSSLVGTLARTLSGTFLGAPGSCGRLAVSWAMAGGIAAGGIVIGTLTLTGVLHSSAHILAAPALFLIGSGLGLVHGVGLGVLARPETLSLGRAWQRSLVGAVCCIPALGFAWIVTVGITLTAALLREWRIPWAVVSFSAWVVGASLCVWAGVEASRALRRVRARWGCGARRALSFAVTAGVAAAVLVGHLPTPWGLEFRSGVPGALLAGLAASCWIGLPLALATSSGLPRPQPGVSPDDGGQRSAPTGAG